MFKTLPTDCSELILPNLDLLATQTGLVIRKSAKFTPSAFLASLLEAVATGKGSMNQLVGFMNDRLQVGMAKQSMDERLNKYAVAFLLEVIKKLMEQRYKPVQKALSKSGVLRVLTEDSSGIRLPKSNSPSFPAHGNHHGPTAGVKIDFVYNLLTSEVIAHTLQSATTQDKEIGKDTIDLVKKDDLVLRDMGYFSIAEFNRIEACGAYWLSRLPLNTKVSLAKGAPLEARLSRETRGHIDLKVYATGQQKYCRLVAIRASSEIVKKRREERCQKAREAGAKPCPKGLIRDGWHLMLTNLSKEQASIKELATLYRARWAIEIQFRAWKQALNLEKCVNRKSNTHHLEVLLLAGMIAHQLGMKVAQILSKQIGAQRLSYEKLYDSLINYLIKVKSISDLRHYAPDPRHIKRDNPSRKSPIASGIELLT